MLQFYVCPIVQHQTTWGTISPVGRVYQHRSRGERYTLHRGMGELVLCSLADPSIATQAAIAADQECVEWPERDALWTTEVGPSRRRIISEILSSHGVPLAWVDVGTTAGDVLRVTLQLANLRQRGQLQAIAQRAVAASAEMEMYDAIRAARMQIIMQGERI